MSVLRPDPAEYIEDFGVGPIRPIDVLCGALSLANAFGIEAEELVAIATRADSIRHFDHLVDDEVEAIRREIDARAERRAARVR